MSQEVLVFQDLPTACQKRLAETLFLNGFDGALFEANMELLWKTNRENQA